MTRASHYVERVPGDLAVALATADAEGVRGVSVKYGPGFDAGPVEIRLEGVREHGETERALMACKGVCAKGGGLWIWAALAGATERAS